MYHLGMDKLHALNRLIIAGFLVAAAVCQQGCVPIYCAVNHSNLPEAEELQMFAWETELGGTFGPPTHRLAVMETSQENRYIAFNDAHDDRRAPVQYVIDESGGIIETLPYRDMRRNSPESKFRKYETYTHFTNESEVYARSNVKVTIERYNYSPWLEVEAWTRQTLGRLVAPFMGKAGVRLIRMPYEPTECCPPTIVVTKTPPGGPTTTRRFTIPDYDIDRYNRIETLVSTDGRFLFIHNNYLASFIGLD